ncbi:MAG: hypothetical protein WD851_25530 [Pirellulales bacterium]
MKYDPATHCISGKYCMKCGKQELRRYATTCPFCKVPLADLRFRKRKPARATPAGSPHPATAPIGPALDGIGSQLEIPVFNSG